MTLRIVHVVAHAFLPPEDGGRLKASCIATALARRGEVHWVSLDDTHRSKGPAAPPQRLELPWGGGGTWHSALEASCKRPLPRSLPGWLRAARAGVWFPPAWIPFTARHGEVMARIARLQPDMVVADETLLAPFAAFAPARWRIVHTHNHDSSLLSQDVFAGSGRGHQLRAAARLERIERVLFPRLDQVWGVRQEDLAAFQGLGVKENRLFLAPNVVPEPCFEEDRQPGTPGRALFFGSLWYPPNTQALEWLLEAWPAVRQRVPGAILSVAGRGAPPALAAKAAQTQGVELLGFVPDLKALLRGAALAVIPLLQGGGTKIKTIEAMAAGLPILASPIAAEGLALEDGVHAVLREPGAGFVEALAAMIQDPGPWTGMGLAARDLARSRYSMAALSDCLGLALDSLLG
jgi:glycosyltransferase involved in cell wall biosynthesis